MVKNLSVVIMGVHAGKPLSRKIRGTFNDYPHVGPKGNRSRAQANGAGENPLNRKGVTATNIISVVKK